MAGTSFTVKIVNFNGKPIADLFDRLRAVRADTRLALADIGEELLITHRARFAAQQSPDGERWQELSPAYSRRKKKNTSRILRLDGFLEDLMRWQATAARLSFGTDRIYGATHQFGDAGRNIPARPYLGLSDDDRSRIIRVLERHLRRATEGR